MYPMFKMRIRNFRKIRKADLEFEGLVWITGPNDNGKSCLLKSIPALMENSTGSSFITYGEKEAEVEVEFDNKNGHQKVTWVKQDKGSGTYTINDDAPLSKTGSTTPPEISDLGFKVLTVKDKKYNLHYWPQGEYFLVKDTPTYIFLMISRLLKHRNLIPMLKKMKADSIDLRDMEKELSGQFKMLEKKKQSLGEQLKLYRNFDRDSKRFKELRAVHEMYQTCLGISERVDSFTQSYTALSSRMEVINSNLQSLSGLPGVREDVVLLSACELLARKVNQTSRNLKAISPEVLAYVPQNTVEVSENLKQLNQLQLLMGKIQRVDKLLKAVDSPALKYTGVELKTAQNLAQALSKLEDLQSRCVSLEQKLAKFPDDYREIAIQLDEVDSDRKQLYIDYPQCPTCGRPWEDCEEK